MPESYSERGFAQYVRDMPTDNGTEASVYESSSAKGDFVWLNLRGTAHYQGSNGPASEHHSNDLWLVDEVSLAAHLDVEQATRLRDCLSEWIAGLNQPRNRTEDAP